VQMAGFFLRRLAEILRSKFKLTATPPWRPRKRNHLVVRRRFNETRSTAPETDALTYRSRLASLGPGKCCLREKFGLIPKCPSLVGVYTERDFFQFNGGTSEPATRRK
jgi:hypothetical protein